MLPDVYFDEQQYQMVLFENEKLKQEQERNKLQHFQNQIELKILKEQMEEQQTFYQVSQTGTNIVPSLIKLETQRKNLVTNAQILLLDHDKTLYRYKKIFKDQKMQIERNLEGVSILYEEALNQVLSNESIQLDFAEEPEIKQDPVITEAVQEFKIQTEERIQQGHQNIIHYKEHKQETINSLNNLIEKIDLQRQEQLRQNKQNKILDYSLKLLKTQAKQLEKEFQLGEMMLKAQQIQETNSKQLVYELSQIEKETEIKLNAPLLKEQIFNTNSQLSTELNRVVKNKKDPEEEDVLNSKHQSEDDENSNIHKQIESQKMAELEKNNQCVSLLNDLTKEIFQKSNNQQQEEEEKQQEQSINTQKIMQDLNIMRSEMNEINNQYENYKKLISQTLQSTTDNETNEQITQSMKYYETCYTLQNSTQNWLEKLSKEISKAETDIDELKKKKQQKLFDMENLSESFEINTTQEVPPCSRARQRLDKQIQLSQITKIQETPEVQEQDQLEISSSYQKLQNSYLDDIKAQANRIGQTIMEITADDCFLFLKSQDQTNRISTVQCELSLIMKNRFSIQQMGSLSTKIQKSIPTRSLEKYFTKKLNLLDSYTKFMKSIKNHV